MKKSLITLLAFILIAFTAHAQDGKKMLKEAEKSMKEYLKDPLQNATSLQAAISSYDGAFADDAIASQPKNWMKKGQMFNELSDNQIKMRLINPQSSLAAPNAAVMAYESYVKAMEVSSKKGDVKKAVEKIGETEVNLSNTAVELYKDKSYDLAFRNFSSSLQAKKILNDNGKESRLDDSKLYNDQVYFTAICGYFGTNKQENIPYLKEMLELPDIEGTESNKPFAYEALFQSYKESGDMETGMSYLSQGREAFPDDTQLLFAEINYYLEKEQLDILIEKLTLALEKEPDNISVMNTLGNVYDKLSTEMWNQGDKETSSKHFDSALKYYTMVLDKQPEEFTATYSVGALYYNKAALLTQELNTLANDFSPEGTKKYTELKEVSDKYFDEALPFFLKAETLDTKDLNTLIALREIYARKSMFEKVNEYKAKYEALEATEGND